MWDGGAEPSQTRGPRGVGRAGIEPATRGLKAPCSTTELTARSILATAIGAPEVLPVQLGGDGSSSGSCSCRRAARSRPSSETGSSSHMTTWSIRRPTRA
jgi:hypothetical protein